MIASAVSTRSEEEAVRFKQVGVSMFECAGMELRKWRSNGENNDSTQPVDGKSFRHDMAISE